MSLLTSCNVGNSQPAPESAFRSNEVLYYDSEQQMDLFTQDKESFEGLFNALYDSEYTFLSFNQRYDGEIRWTILNTDETEIAQFKDVKMLAATIFLMMYYTQLTVFLINTIVVVSTGMEVC